MYKDTISVVKEYERLIKSQKQNIICLVNRQVLIFSNFEDSEKFLKILKELGISKSNINLKINLFKLIVKYPKLNNSSLNYKLHFKPVKVILGQVATASNLQKQSKFYIFSIYFNLTFPHLWKFSTLVHFSQTFGDVI